jgi:3-mercaptopyruvate sulfurtransferase SseA
MKGSLPFLLLVAGVVLLVGGSVVYLLNRPAPSQGVTPIPDDQVEAGVPYPEVARISLAEAKAHYDAGEAVVVDVRTREDYETLHVPNAISLPLSELSARYEELPLEAEILTYCT